MIKETKTIKIRNLLVNEHLKIPPYQRPYKWTTKNVNQLIDDILFFKRRNAYRIGSIIIHQDNKDGCNYIVDGQQRTITLLLMAYALKEKGISNFSPKINWEFDNPVSQSNIRTNYKEIKRRIKEFDESATNFFLDKCELVKIVCDDISEAFQFFDVQNTRGKDLEPHDLLKAFHLRAMSSVAETQKTQIVKEWERMDTGKLARLFENYLFRIRNWSRGYSARFFNKSDIEIFKGIDPNSRDILPYAEVFRIAHFYIQKYNNNTDRNIDTQYLDYPFQLDTVMLNGTRFFEFVEHYSEKIKKIAPDPPRDITGYLGVNESHKILKTINEYKAKNRRGDKYIRNLFDCLLIFYIDKFGIIDIEKAIEKFFICAYQLRLKRHAVKLATVDNYALESKMFKTIREANTHQQILNYSIHNIKESEIRSSKTEKIVELFKNLGYYDAK